MKVLVSVILALVAISGLTKADDAKKGQFPSVVTLQIPGDYGGEYDVCTGVIISPTTILTVASCVSGIKWVMAGMTQVIEGNTYPPPPYLQQVDVIGKIIHPDYDINRENEGLVSLNDIALLKLSEKLNYSDVIQPLSLPTENSSIVDDSLIQAAGWGKYLNQNNLVYGYSQLQTANVTAVDYQTCYDAVDAIVAGKDIIMLDKDSTQCIGPIADGNSLPTTYGDYGGPLIQNNQVVGVSTWTVEYWKNDNAKGKKGPVGIYTKVSRYVSWIKQNTPDL